MNRKKLKADIVIDIISTIAAYILLATMLFSAIFSVISAEKLSNEVEDVISTLEEIDTKIDQQNSEIEQINQSVILLEEKWYELPISDEDEEDIQVEEEVVEVIETPAETITIDIVEKNDPYNVSWSLERLPDGDTNTYRCMDYRKITNTKSDQYYISTLCKTEEETGIRYIEYRGEKYYTCALGSAYGIKLGNCWEVTLGNGNKFKIMMGEYKHDITKPDPNDYGDPDKNYDGENTINVIEFIIDEKAMSNSIYRAGTMSKLERFGGLYGNGGNIVEMKYLGYVNPKNITEVNKG